MDDKLTNKEKLEITVQTGLQLVPYIGGALASSYFSVKQEKRFKRLESFYQELSAQISRLEDRLPSVEAHDKDSLIALIERINDEVERESSDHKRIYLKNFFISMLQNPTVKQNYDERQMLLDTLTSITFFEFHVLLSMSNNHTGYAIDFPDADPAVKEGAVARLEMLGLLQSTYMAETRTGTSPVNQYVSVSSFGIKFINFCLNIEPEPEP
ncbi:hypothetical protein ACIQYS_09840 [Psychrobacillus sp. NPDC096426]|uniref:hypothetical protein n=1 Tax=Psychrobacillus sp. NPDC096426 TaxID=3364491 RepID=UPI003822789B